MIVRRLRLHPFGCFADRELRFAPGLTVVLGPNEAGKSTIFAALRSSFLRSRLTKRELAEYIDRHLPASGGDSVRLELDFEQDGKSWRLKRSWGARPSSELVLPGGGSLGDDEAVRERLETVLPARQGTFWKVLMAGQTELARTVDALAGDTGRTLADLGDILRAAVLETGGVSVDRFRSLLDGRIESAFLNWDRERGQPRNGRGIENPWKKEIGEVLTAWYAREGLRAAAASARAWEKSLDELNARLRETSSAAVELEAFVTGHAKAAADAQERGKLDARSVAVGLEIESLTALAAEWPRAVERTRALAEAIEALSAQRVPLLSERQEAEREQEAGKLREKAERVMRRKRALEQARRRLAAVPALERTSLEEIRNAARELDRLQAGLEAGKLSVMIAGRKDVEIGVQEDFAAQSPNRLTAGSILRLQAAGRIRIVHPDLEIEVTSGGADAQGRLEKTQSARRRLAEALAAAGASSPSDAESRWSVVEPLAADATAAVKALADELGEDEDSAFEQRVAALGPVRPVRTLAAIATDLARGDALVDEKGRELDELHRRLGEWEAKHGSQEALIGRLADARNTRKGYQDQAAGLAPLPDGFPDAVSFLRAWEAARQRAQELRASEGALRAERAGLAARPPEMSAEEAAAQLSDAEAELSAVNRRSQALERISRAADDLSRGSDSAVSSVMRADLEKTLAGMTSGRYTSVDMDGALPRAVAARGGASLGWDLLSVGTRDTLALALRLVMARHFLAGTDGFLVMDDPLVDMDPDRQRAAAGALREFASQRQLIIFTCHPAAAELLGGALVEL